MLMTYRELLSIKEMSQAKVVAGKSGLYRTLSWYSIVEILNFKEENYEDKLVFVSGIGMQDYEQEILSIIEQSEKMGASGIVLEIGPFIPDVPKSVKKKGDELGFPILTIPYEIKISQVTYAMTQFIFERINYFHGIRCIVDEIITQKNSRELEERAVYYGYLEGEPYYSIVVEEDDDKFHKQKVVMDKLLIAFLSAFNQLAYEGVLWSELNGNLTFFVPWKKNDNLKKEVETYLKLVKEDWHTQKYKLSISIGVGALFNDLGEMNQSKEQAKQALSMIKKCQKRNEIRIYEDIGVYRLFFEYNDSEEVIDIYENILGELREYDKEHETDLLNTLGVYLDSGCNIGIAAETLEVHRNTMKYRIKRIQEILNVDFSDQNQCFNLRLAYKIKKYMNL